MNKKYIFFLLFIFLFSCAQQNQPLTGGPQDTISPVVKKSIPKNKDTGYVDNKIIIKFNEYIILENFDKNFFSSPPFSAKPKFKIAGKKIIISIKEKLKDSVTYTLSFANSIVDLNEKNALNNYEFVFSTYDQIDSMKISGVVIDAYTYKPIADAFVMFYDKYFDSIPLQQTPLYVSKTDSSGYFEIKNIKQKNYKIFALYDLNNNFIYNQDENQIAFIDTLIFPYSVSKTRFDTIDSGTVVKKLIQDSVFSDTLKADSITMSKYTEFLPNDITLLMYSEMGENQAIKRKTRVNKGSVKIFFTKQLINDYVSVSSLKNTDEPYSEHVIEKFPSNDSITIWFKNQDFFDVDSLKFLISYYSNNYTLKTDTINIADYDYSTDSSMLLINQPKENISIFEHFSIIFSNPIVKIDTSKVKLFKVIDTLVTDEKNQKISFFRPTFDSIVFVFSRQTNNFSLNFKGIVDNDSAYLYNFNKTKDTVYCKILNKKILEQDTIFLTVEYDNLYFFNQIQNLNSELIVPISFQKIKKITRLSQDTIVFYFQKTVSKNHEIELLNYSPEDFSVYPEKDVVKIYLKNKKAIFDDTLKFVFSMKDMTLLNGKEINYNDTVNAIYVFDKQKITYNRRIFRSKIIIGFKKPLLELPELKLLSFNPLNKWYTIKTNTLKDTIFIDIHNERVKRLNNIIFSVKYFDINQHNDTLRLADTLNLKVEKIENVDIEEIGREKKLTLYQPLNLEIERDSIHLRKYNIKGNYPAGFEYFVDIDSAAFSDIYNKQNDTCKLNFRVFAPEEYAILVIELQNIWVMLDSVETKDTTGYYELKKGLAVLIIEDENNEIYKTKTLNSDKILKDALVIPGTYHLKLYYDENSNNQWDGGNYFKHIKPEKVYIYDKKITLSKGSEQKIIWNLKE